MGEFTEDNDGLVWRAAVLAQGYTDSDIKRAIGFGRLHRIWPGVYASASPDRGLDDLRRLRVIAAVRACDQPMVVSHSSAGLLHGLPLLQPSYRRVHLSTGRAEGGRVEKWRHLHTGALAADEVARVGGLSVTTLERTAVDCARSGSFDEAVVAFDSALRMGADRVVMAALLDRLRGSRGVSRAQRALDVADSLSESVGESWSRAQSHLLAPLALSVWPSHGSSSLLLTSLALVRRQSRTTGATPPGNPPSGPITPPSGPLSPVMPSNAIGVLRL